MRLAVAAAVFSLPLLASGCSPVRNLTLHAVDSQSGNPIASVHVQKITPLISAPWSWLLLPGGVAPDIEERDADDGGKVRFVNSNNCWYRLHVDGYKDVDIGQLWLQTRSLDGRKHSILPDKETHLYRVSMQRLQ